MRGLLMKMILFLKFFIFPIFSESKFAQFEHKDCIDRINKIQSIPKGIIDTACTELKRMHVSFNILTFNRGPNCKNILLINGEDHDSLPIMRKPMYLMSEPFPVRLNEDAWDVKRVKGIEKTVAAIDSRHKKNKKSVEEAYDEWQKLLTNYNGRIPEDVEIPKGSPLDDIEHDPGIHLDVLLNSGKFMGEFNYGDANERTTIWKKFISNIGSVGVKSCSLYRVNDVTEGYLTPITYIRIFKDFVGQPGFPPITISSEFGKLKNYIDFDCKDFNSLSCRNYIQKERNKRLAENIRLVMNELPCGIPVSVTLGAAHIEGLSRNLEKKGFQETDSELSKYSYFNFPNSDPDYPGRPNQN